MVPPKSLCRTFGPVGLSYRQLEEEFRKLKKPVGSSWRVDETYIKVRGQWKYLSRAIDKDGATKDFFAYHKARCECCKTIFQKRLKYLNNIVEQEHRAIKRNTHLMLGFKSFRSATKTLAGIEMMHMIRKGQMAESRQLTPAEQFYSLAGYSRRRQGLDLLKSNQGRIGDRAMRNGLKFA